MISNFLKPTLPIKLKFRRFEFKYRLPSFVADKIMNELLNYMEWDSYVVNQPDKSYQVSSLYFDTAGFDCYHEKLAGVKDRKKLRFRTYLNKFQPATPVFLEIKRKSDMIILKDRLVSNYHSCTDFINTGQFNSVNSLSTQEQKLLKEFLWLKNYNCLLPKLMVIYRRKPLIGRLDPGFRVTLDSQIRAYPANQLFFSQKAIEVFPRRTVMELKYNNTVPYWFHQIIQKYQLNREPFSKYCQSLEAARNYFLHV